MYTLKTKLANVKGIGPKLSQELADHDLHTVSDLVLLLPLRYEDRSKFVTIKEIPADELITFQATITSISQFYKNRKSIQSAKAKDATGSIKLMWFNNKFIFSRLKEGEEYLISGKKGFNNTIIQPVVEAVKAETLHTNRLVPLYSSSIAIKQGSLRHILKEIVDNLKIEDDDLDKLLTSGSLHSTLRQDSAQVPHIPLSTVIKELHFPSTEEMIEQSRQRLVLEEFLSLMKISDQLKQYWNSKNDALAITVKDSWEQTIPATIPFELTQAQKRVVSEILTDIAKTTPMNRIVIGDVGSGKTVVAGIACQHVLANGQNAALIAPTKILAEQHAATINKLFPELEVELVIAGNRAKSKKDLHSTTLRSKLYIGTHAILNRLETIQPALIIYDEQHRFGVNHRSQAQALPYSPHILTMTATPIPRSMMLTLFSHLQLSIIDELPKGRIPPKTWLISESKRSDAYQWITEQLATSSDTNTITQVIVVCPFIDPSTALALENVAAAKETFSKIAKAFPEHRTELLHGRMAKKDQAAIIADLFNKKITILVTTPIVEVGVDLPQASIIIIEAAERFGLSSLHQLRGRVGRAGQESYCLLFTTSRSQSTKTRLKAFCEESSGFKLAELDLENRGAGDIFGAQQSGFSGLRYGSWTNHELMYLAQQVYKKLQSDWQPSLIKPITIAETMPYAN